MVDVRKVQPRAVAIRYDQKSESSPRVVAAGQGDIAEKIIAAAEAAGLDIVQDPDLLEILASVPVNDDIPPEMFQAVAEILVFVYRLNGRYASAFGE